MEMAPWALLAAAFASAALTFNALRPAHRWPWLGPSFFAAWLTSEFALHHLLWQGLLVAALVHLGGLAHAVGWVGIGVAAISWLGLGSMVAAALRDEAVFRAALDEALPSDGSRAVSRLSWVRVLFPFRARRWSVERVRDLSYVQDGKRRHRLDIYRMRGDGDGRKLQRPKPVLLQIHGGAWMVGSKDHQGLPLLNHMASRGYVCVAINYALSPNATWPEHLIDCKRALKWIREHIHEFGGDPDFVIATGGSAGGHLTAMMALTGNEAEWQPGFEHVDTRIDGFVPFYGVYDWSNRFGIRRQPDALARLLERHVVKRTRSTAPEVFEHASPMSHIGKNVPPAMVIHGTQDNLAPASEARRFVEALRAASVEPVAYAELRGAHHAFDVFPSIRTLFAMAAVERFAGWLCARRWN